MIVARLFVVACVAAALSGCAHREVKVTPQPSQLVGQAPGDTIETIPGALLDHQSTVISVVRAYDNAGFLNVCGALVMAAPSINAAELASYASDSASDLEIGPEGGKNVHVVPRFMHRYYLNVPSGVLDPKALDYSTLSGDCIATDVPWEARYQSDNRLHLRKVVRVRR